MCEGLSKISSNFTLHLIKVGKLKRFKKVSSDLKTILMTDLANLRSLGLSINLNLSHQLDLCDLLRRCSPHAFEKFVTNMERNDGGYLFS